MKNLLSILLLFLSLGIAKAQTTHVVYLKNGKALYGNYSLNPTSKELKLQVNKDSTITLPFDSVSTIATDPELKLEKRKAYGVAKVGINSLNASLGISVSAGFVVTRNIKIGAGLELYKSLMQQEPMKIYLTEYMPVFAEARYEWDKEKAKPFILLQTGFGYVVRNQLDYYELTPTGIITRMKEGGMMAGLYGGCKYATKVKGLYWFWEIGGKLMGYTTQTTTYTNGIKDRVEKTDYMPYLNLNFGFAW